MKLSLDKSLKLRYCDIVFYLINLNILFSLVFDNTKIYYYYILNPVITFFLIIELRKNYKLFQKVTVFLVIIGASTLLATLTGSSLGKLNNHLFNFVNTFLLFIYCSQDRIINDFKRFIRENLSFLKCIVLIVSTVEIVMLIKNSGWVYIYSWSGYFFQGTSKMPHTLSYLMLVIIILVCTMIVIEKKKKYYIFTFIPSYCIFISGARVSLLLCGIIHCILLSYIFAEKQKSIILKTLKILPLVTVFLIIFKDQIIYSSLVQKVLIRIESGNSSAGRSYMVADLFNHFIKDSNLLQYFLGQGDDKTYYYNSINPLVKSEVWAHNDVMQILIGKGIMGIFIYFYSIYIFIKKAIRDNGNIYTLAIIVFLFIAILLNGFYSYKDISLCIPYLMVINKCLTYKRMEN